MRNDGNELVQGYLTKHRLRSVNRKISLIKLIKGKLYEGFILDQ